MIATEQNPFAIAVDSQTVYWLNGDGTVMSCAKTGCGAPSLVATGTAVFYPGRVITDGTNVYWSTEDTLYACPVGGCTSPILIADGQNNVRGLAVANGLLYWGSGDAIESCSISGCGDSPTTLATGQFIAMSVATDGTNLYWTSSNAAVRKCSLASCTPTTLYSAPFDTALSLALDATSAWIWHVSTNYTEIRRVALDGSGSVNFAYGSGYGPLAVDATDLYAVGAANQAVERFAFGGGVATLGTGNIRDMTIDSSYVYWAIGEGDILRLPK